MKRLIVNADDYGMSQDINCGIIEAHRRGIVSSASLMATGDAYEHALLLAANVNTLDLGAHIVLTGGWSCVDPHTPLPTTPTELLREIIGGRFDVGREIRSQLQKMKASGITPSHINTHKGVHLFPPVMKALANCAAEFGIKWIRLPIDLGWRTSSISLKRRLVDGVFSSGAGWLRRCITREGCSTTDHFVGLYMIGTFSPADLVRLFAWLSAGTTELMCHPG